MAADNKLTKMRRLYRKSELLQTQWDVMNIKLAFYLGYMCLNTNLT